jgi:predicted HTH transcriptional regulator
MAKKVGEVNRELLRLIEEGEHQHQDFKYCINDAKKIARSLVAFANTDGGMLLIGVKDNGKVIGISTDEEYYMVESAATIYSKPPVVFTTRQWQSEGRTVLGIQVPPGGQKPYFARDDQGKWLAYIRINDENVLAHKIYLMVWRKQASPRGIHFTFSDTECFLVDYLQQHEHISLSQFMRLAHISRANAEEVLSNFIVLNVIQMVSSRDKTLFVLNQEYDQTELKKFHKR